MDPIDSTKAELSALRGCVLVDRYRLDALLGAGGMGGVFDAHESYQGFERRVAVKLVLPRFSNQSDWRARFVREATMAAEVQHQNIVQVLHFGEDAKTGSQFLVMEFLGGRSLAQVLHDEGRMPSARAIPILRQICWAISAAHTKELIHRDLKPGNIMLIERDGARDFVKIVDFGLAKPIAPGKTVTSGNVPVGTPAYMAPEQIFQNENERLDPRADIYAIGAIAYTLLTGRPPFASADNLMSLYLAKLSGVGPPLADVSEKLNQTIAKAMAGHAADRHRNARELDLALASALEDKPRTPPAASRQTRRIVETESALGGKQAPRDTAPESGQIPRTFLRPDTSGNGVSPTPTVDRWSVLEAEASILGIRDFGFVESPDGRLGIIYPGRAPGTWSWVDFEGQETMSIMHACGMPQNPRACSRATDSLLTWVDISSGKARVGFGRWARSDLSRLEHVEIFGPPDEFALAPDVLAGPEGAVAAWHSAAQERSHICIRQLDRPHNQAPQNLVLGPGAHACLGRREDRVAVAWHTPDVRPALRWAWLDQPRAVQNGAEDAAYPVWAMHGEHCALLWSQIKPPGTEIFGALIRNNHLQKQPLASAAVMAKHRPISASGTAEGFWAAWIEEQANDAGGALRAAFFDWTLNQVAAVELDRGPISRVSIKALSGHAVLCWNLERRGSRAIQVAIVRIDAGSRSHP